MAFLSVYQIFTIYFSIHDDEREQWALTLIQTLLIIFSVWFLGFEVYQLKKNGRYYFSDWWNFTDVFPICAIIFLIVFENFADYRMLEDTIQIRHGLQAVTSFLMWIKIFYFLRIFRHTGFFVNMLKGVVKESAIFFLLYILVLLAFTSSFYILYPPDTDDTFRGVLFYSYLLSLGEFDMEWDDYYAPWMVQTFFTLSTLLVLIVMLNILIALVSKAYE